MRKKNTYRFIAILLILTLLLSGCASTGRDDGSEPAFKHFSPDKLNTADSGEGETEDPENNPDTEQKGEDAGDKKSPGSTEGAGQNKKPEQDHSSDQDEDPALEYTYEYVKATLRDGTLTITLLPDAAAEHFGSNSGLRCNEPYPVSGLTGSYTDLFIGSMGNSVSPFVFLLTEGGGVECVPVGIVLEDWVISRPAGDPAFVSIGELPHVSDIVSFYEDTVSYDNGGYVTVFAVAADGVEADLSFPYYYAVNPQDAPPSEEMAEKIILDNLGPAGLEDLVDRGLYMIAPGLVETINGDPCCLMGVGDEDTDNLGHLQYFAAAANGAVYERVGEPELWRPCNLLAEIYSGSSDPLDLFSIISEPNGTELEELYFTGRKEEVFLSDSALASDTPMLLLPLKNDVNIKVELIDFNIDGEIESETVLADLTLSRGDLCAIYAHVMFDTSPLFIYAAWQDGPCEYTVYWWAVSGAGYGEVYMEYVAGFEADDGSHAMG